LALITVKSIPDAVAQTLIASTAASFASLNAVAAREYGPSKVANNRKCLTPAVALSVPSLALASLSMAQKSFDASALPSRDAMQERTVPQLGKM